MITCSEHDGAILFKQGFTYFICCNCGARIFHNDLYPPVRCQECAEQTGKCQYCNALNTKVIKSMALSSAGLEGYNSNNISDEIKEKAKQILSGL